MDFIQQNPQATQALLGTLIGVIVFFLSDKYYQMKKDKKALEAQLKQDRSSMEGQMQKILDKLDHTVETWATTTDALHSRITLVEGDVRELRGEHNARKDICDKCPYEPVFSNAYARTGHRRQQDPPHYQDQPGGD